MTAFSWCTIKDLNITYKSLHTVTQNNISSCQNQWTQNCKLNDTWLNCKAVAAVFNTQMKSGSRILWIKCRGEMHHRRFNLPCDRWNEIVTRPFNSFWTFGLSMTWIVGNWSHRSRLSRRIGFIFVKPSACIRCVGIHLVCLGLNVSWIALMFTKLRLSVNVLLTASRAS